MEDRRRRFEALVRPVLADLYRFALRLTRDRVAAEDLLQTALVRGLDRLSQLGDDGAFRVWQSRVLYTTFVNSRQGRPMMLLEDEDPRGLDAVALPRSAGPEAAAGQRELGARIADAMDKLPAEQREAVWLVDGQGFKFAEAAEVLGVPPGTVASRVARGRISLRADLARVAADEGVGR